MALAGSIASLISISRSQFSSIFSFPGYNTRMIIARLRRSLLIFVLLSSFIPARSVLAQSEMPVYIVQFGDSIASLSLTFHTPPDRLIRANALANPDQLTPGMSLFIPSLAGHPGTLTLVPLALGDSLHALARQNGISDDQMSSLNFITRPEALPVGANVILLNAQAAEQTRIPLTSGITDLELSASYGVSPWTVSEANNLQGPWDLLQNDTLVLPVAPASGAVELMPGVTGLAAFSLPLEQGKTALFNAAVSQGVTLSGSLTGRPVEFLQEADGSSSAYVGIPRMTEPGMLQLRLTTLSVDGRSFTLDQNLWVKKVTTYGVDYPFQVADVLVDPLVTGPETAQVNQVVAPITPAKYWSGKFVSPSPVPDCITSTFGRLRSYNGSDYIYFHSGIDFCGSETTPIFAAADGVVVFASELTIRGNATIIDHGQGVYTGYWHQSQFMVNVGDRVTAGQQIGVVGATGRVTGPHLHFEVFVDGAQVDPTEWLQGRFP